MEYIMSNYCRHKITLAEGPSYCAFEFHVCALELDKPCPYNETINDEETSDEQIHDNTR